METKVKPRCAACYITEVEKEGDVCEECRTKTIFMGYTRVQLHEAFQRVKPSDDWKNPIDTTFRPAPSEAERSAIDAAVAFYTGSHVQWRWASGGVRARAVGYYLTIGS